MRRTAFVLSLLLGVALITVLTLAPFSNAQGRGGFRDEQETAPDLIAEFDKNENGRLEADERAAALADLKNNPRSQGRGKGGKGGKGRKGGRRGGGESVRNKPGRKIESADVEHYPDHSLYDDSIMRTFFIEFDTDKWETEMAQLKDYGVDIGASVTVDGKQYDDVGVRFRGNSSFFSVQDGQKRSLNLTFDWADQDQDIYGYRTLNLLNSHSDGSFLRSVLYSRIAGEYTAVSKSNFVHVVINGESWGVYINEQQMNTDFMKENFGTRKGGRFKAPPGPAGRSFSYQGDDKRNYVSAYELKSKDKEATWETLINATKVLSQTPVAEIETTVDEVLSIDRALWFLAVDNVLLDVDGYHERGADFAIYQEPKFGRTIILPYDNNETFRAQSGAGGNGGSGGPGGGPPGGMFGGFFEGPPKGEKGGPGGPGGGPQRGGRGGRGGPASFGGTPKDPAPFALDIFSGEDHEGIPVVSKLLKNPAVRARYVAHVRTIQQQWIDWETVSPIIDQYRDLIGDEVKKDTRKLASLKAYDDGIGMSEASSRSVAPGLKAFFAGRKAYLDKVPELQQPYPEFESVQASSGKVIAKLKSGTTEPDRVFLYWATDRLAKYLRTEMVKAGDEYSVQIPADAKGKQLFYYVEGRTNDKYLTTSFYPPTAESNPLATKKPPKPPVKPFPAAASTDVVINEVMASNDKTIADANGEFGDWIELANTSDKDVDLSGVYLSDSMANPLKFEFPKGTKIKAGGFLMVWADGGSGDGAKQGSELHAGFKLSKKGEAVLLVKSFGSGASGSKKLLDSVEFGVQTTDQSFGRTAGGKFESFQSPTPGKKNSF